MIYFTSDLHINDLRVFNGSRKKYFKTISGFHEYLIKKWNNKVTDEDLIIVLGDVGIDTESTVNMLNQLNGRKVLILGNHDIESLDFLPDAFIRTRYLYCTCINGTLVGCSHKPKLYPDLHNIGCDVYIHGHHHEYESITMMYQASRLLSNHNRYNACIDLNFYEPCTLEELKYNKPYQLQIFKDDWFMY